MPDDSVPRHGRASKTVCDDYAVSEVTNGQSKLEPFNSSEKLAVRRSGLGYRVTLHVQTDPEMALRDAHVLSGKVKSAIRAAVPQVQYVLVHLEPFERARATV